MQWYVLCDLVGGGQGVKSVGGKMSGIVWVKMSSAQTFRVDTQRFSVLSGASCMWL